MSLETDLSREIRFLERSYARGEMSWEELISRKRDLLVHKTHIPKRNIPPKKQISNVKQKNKIKISDKRNGIIFLVFLAIIALATYVFVFGSPVSSII